MSLRMAMVADVNLIVNRSGLQGWGEWRNFAALKPFKTHKRIMKREKIFERRLSEHFTVGDLARTGEAERYGIDNIPTERQVERMKALCERVLEPMRGRFGRLHVVVGFRCRKLHEALGATGSRSHLRGEAVCLHVSSMEVALKMYRFATKRIGGVEIRLSEPMSNGCRLMRLSVRSEVHSSLKGEDLT